LILINFRKFMAGERSPSTENTLVNGEFFRWHLTCFTTVSNQEREDMKMNATTNEARLALVANGNETVEATAGTRLAQNSLLSELPGVVFGLLTLGYVVSSLLALA
jgi:hypothetical protein